MNENTSEYYSLRSRDAQIYNIVDLRIHGSESIVTICNNQLREDFYNYLRENGITFRDQGIIIRSADQGIILAKHTEIGKIITISDSEKVNIWDIFTLLVQKLYPEAKFDWEPCDVLDHKPNLCRE